MGYKPTDDPVELERRRAAKRQHYHQNKQPYKDRALRKREEIRKLLITAKNVPCMDCGVRYPPYVMDFDHRDPTTKLYNVASLVVSASSMRIALEEIAKCDVVCANCHRERTYGKN